MWHTNKLMVDAKYRMKNGGAMACYYEEDDVCANRRRGDGLDLAAFAEENSGKSFTNDESRFRRFCFVLFFELQVFITRWKYVY